MKRMHCGTIDCILICYEYCLDDLFCLSIDTLYIIARRDNVISAYANYHYMWLQDIYSSYVCLVYICYAVNVDVWVKHCCFFVLFLSVLMLDFYLFEKMQVLLGLSDLLIKLVQNSIYTKRR